MNETHCHNFDPGLTAGTALYSAGYGSHAHTADFNNTGAHTHLIIDQNWAQARAAARTHTADEYRTCKPERQTCRYCGCRFAESKFHPGHCISCGAPHED